MRTKSWSGNTNKKKLKNNWVEEATFSRVRRWWCAYTARCRVGHL